MKLSDYVMERVAQAGVRHVFLLPGGGAMHLVDSLGRSADLRYVCNLHEQAAAIAADAYGQYTGNLGVALVTTGPGGTNAITGLAAAWLDSTPCLFLSGQVKRADLGAGRGVRQMGFQELDICQIVRPITKYAVRVDDPASIRRHLDRAMRLARSGRPGPVWLDIPLDVQAAEVDPAGMAPTEDDGPLLPPREALRPAVRQALELLAAAQRPVILAGNGVRLAGAIEKFLELADRLQVPLLTTWKAMDFLPDDHPLFIGRPGAVGQRAANFAQQNADYLLVLGARLDLGQTAYNPRGLARGAKKVVADIDPAEIRKLDMPLAVTLCGDLRDTIELFLEEQPRFAARPRAAWWNRCREWKRRFPVVRPEYWNETSGVNLYVLMDVLGDELCGSDLVVPGSSGAASEVTMQALRVKAGMRVFNSQGLGAMGFAIPAAIGGCLASGRRTIAIDGDGSLQMNSQELETVRRLNLPIKLFVLDNGGYASIQATQRNYFQGRYVACNPQSGLTLPDTLALAAAYGLPALSIGSQTDLRRQVRRVLEQQGPVVCNVSISPNQCTAPRVASVQREDGSITSRPMEDLWPLLDREEFQANMIVAPMPE
ncbi:MAG: thiamine pyrophosphate-binding protein [Thermoguttaceae bacterium]|jgi:acetolactate synthase-1/2/3 large subunit